MNRTVVFFWAMAVLLALSGSAVARTGPDSSPAVPVEDTTSVEADSIPAPVSSLLKPEKVDLWATGANPSLAVLMSPVFPGWGQLYTENGWRSALSFGSQMWFWSRMITRDRRAVRARQIAETFAPGEQSYTAYHQIAEENWEQMRDFAWWSGGAMFIIALDAYVGSHLFHFEEDQVPVPNRWDDIFDRPGGGMPGSVEAPSVVVMQWQYRF